MTLWILREWEHELDFDELCVDEKRVTLAWWSDLALASEEVMADDTWTSLSEVILRLVFPDQYRE